MNKILLNLTILLSTATLLSQNYTGTLSDIHQNGFYKIWLTPDVRSASQSNLQFFRILDSHKNDVPYVLLNAESSILSTYLPFKFLSTIQAKDSVTAVVIDNKNGQKLDHLTFKIANTKVKKTYSVSGSNDGSTWFGLITNQLFYGLNEAEKTTVEQTFSFPLNDYKFLKFDFSNKTSFPLQILAVGIYKNQNTAISQIELTDYKLKYTNNQEDKLTKIHVNFKTPQHIESIDFNIENEVFLRKAKILVNKTQTLKKHTENYQNPVFNFELHSETYNNLELPYVFEKEIIIEIQNNDNPPLNIKQIKFYQKPLYVVCHLNSNEAYTVIIDTTLQKPIYDLDNFKNTFNLNIPEASIKKFVKIKAQNNISNNQKMFWQTNLFMWICILLAILVISYFAVGLLKDLKK